MLLAAEDHHQHQHERAQRRRAGDEGGNSDQLDVPDVVMAHWFSFLGPLDLAAARQACPLWRTVGAR